MENILILLQVHSVVSLHKKGGLCSPGAFRVLIIISL